MESFGVHELKVCRAEKSIKIEFIVVYSPDINGIAERTNGLIVTKARCLPSDSNLDQLFWSNAFETATYLLNQTPSSTLDYDIPIEA